MRIAVIGAGIAGNVVAARLHASNEVTVFEAAPRVGGHTHTHELEIAGRQVSVDTGFIVYNERTYPRFTALLARLGVATQESSMSFSVRDEASGLEYNGTSLNALFAQRRNLVRPAFLGMVRDILRFNRDAPRLLGGQGPDPTLGDLLAAGRYGRAFREHYIVPMGAAIWSTDPARMLDFPPRLFIRFLHNHGMLTVNDRPVWRTITGGSARYVERLIAPFADRIRLATPVESVRRLPGGVLVKPRGHEAQRFDAVFLACHCDEALRLLADPDPGEREVLGAHHVEERGVRLLAVGPVAREALAVGLVEAQGRPGGAVGEEHADLLEGLADGADPVAEGLLRPEPAPQPAGRRGRGEAHAQALTVGRHVVPLDLPARKHVVARGELALRVALDEQDLEPAGWTVPEQHERGGRGRNGGLGHGRRLSACRDCGMTSLTRTGNPASLGAVLGGMA